MMRIDLMFVPEPPSESGRELRVDPHCRELSHGRHPVASARKGPTYAARIG